jgi:hypothetical protein
MLNDPPIGAVTWPNGPVGPAAAGQVVDGLPCGIQHGNIGYHIHVHLSIYLNGTRLRVPADVGIGGANLPAPLCMYALHTHDATGIIHVENPVPRRFTLGQFFMLWGQPLSDSNVAGQTGLPVVAWIVDRNSDNQLSLSRHVGDLNEIEMQPRRNIVLQLGAPLTQIQTYRYGSE